MNEQYAVRLTDLVFSAGHFITYNGGECERLHGHNYRVAIEVEGPLDENHYVFDFIALKKQAAAILLELDHHMLVATKNPLLQVTASRDEVEIRFSNKRWIFPSEDCVLLDIANTTVELLANYFAQRLLTVLQDQYQFQPSGIQVAVEENFGQVARMTARI